MTNRPIMLDKTKTLLNIKRNVYTLTTSQYILYILRLYI